MLQDLVHKKTIVILKIRFPYPPRIRLYRGCRIRLYHFVIADDSLVDTHKSVTLGLGSNRLRLQHFTCKII